MVLSHMPDYKSNRKRSGFIYQDLSSSYGVVIQQWGDLTLQISPSPLTTSELTHLVGAGSTARTQGHERFEECLRK